MQEIFEYRGIGRSTRMGEKLGRPNVNEVYKDEMSLRNFVPIVWNTMLPENLKRCASLDDFKSLVKSWIPNSCPCRLCKCRVNDVGFIELFDYQHSFRVCVSWKTYFILHRTYYAHVALWQDFAVHSIFKKEIHTGVCTCRCVCVCRCMYV